MSTPIIVIHDIETGEIIEREMNSEELAQLSIEKAKAKANAAAEAKAAADKAALLEKLGITEDEARLLLG